MRSNIPRLWKIIAGCVLAASAAAAVVCLRLAMARPEPARLPFVTRISTESTRQISPVVEADLASLITSDPGRRLERMMEEEPGELMEWIDTLQDRKLAMELTGRFVKAIRNPHHDLLVDWLTRQKDGQIAALIFDAILPRLSRENPQECIAISFALGDSQDARAARETLFSALPLEQRVQLMKQQKPEERAWLLGSKAGSFGTRAPELCLEMIEELPPSAHRTEAVAGLMKAWANGADVFHLADPVSAVKGAMAITEPELRRECLDLALREWSDKNPDIASRWITTLPTGPDRDAAIGGLVARLAPADPGAAAEWAAEISDEALRTQTIGRLKKQPPSLPKEEP